LSSVLRSAGALKAPHVRIIATTSPASPIATLRRRSIGREAQGFIVGPRKPEYQSEGWLPDPFRERSAKSCVAMGYVKLLHHLRRGDSSLCSAYAAADFVSRARIGHWRGFPFQGEKMPKSMQQHHGPHRRLRGVRKRGSETWRGQGSSPCQPCWMPGSPWGPPRMAQDRRLLPWSISQP
jgi:hypothetical protein